MITELLHGLQVTLFAMGSVGVFTLALVQELIPPIPSTLVTVSAGFVFLSGEAMSWDAFLKLFWMVGLPIALGLTLGAIVVYGLVYWGGRPLVEKWGSKVGFSWKDIEKIQEYMKGHKSDDLIMFAARCFPLMPSLAINVFCGIVRWPPVSFVIYTFFGTIVRAMWSGFIGWQFASIYHRYATVVEHAQNVILAGFIIAVAVFLYWRWKKTRRGTLNTEEVSG